MIYCTPLEEKACAKVCKSDCTPFPVRPGLYFCVESCVVDTLISNLPLAATWK